MNERFKDTRDGKREHVDVARVSAIGERTANRTEYLEVYWPFALGENFSETWDVTHLPSGYSVAVKLTRRNALKLVRQLRAAEIDYSFTAPKGRKWDAAKKPMGDIARPYRLSAEQPA